MNSDDVNSGGSSAQLPTSGDTRNLGPTKVEPDDSAGIGQVIDGRWRITAKLGEGGMGEVYAATHVHIEKRAAIKLLRSEILSNQEAVKRFHQEARSASSIGHQNIVAIEDFGNMPDGRVYLCMELLEGQPLNDMIKEPVAPERLMDILIQTCHGLGAAHKKGIVHRDMKPENIFVTRGPDGRDIPKLLDFGIAKVQGTDGDNNLTKTGTIFGTPFYMAPEQAQGDAGMDHRVDIYAMGVIMYEMFTGSVPFEGESFLGILTKHIVAEPELPGQRAARNGRSLLPGLEPIIIRAMKKQPDERYQTMDELLSALVSLRRSLVGPGMSAYMDAQMPHSGVMPALDHAAGSSHLPAMNTPAPFTGSGSMPAMYGAGDSLASSSMVPARGSKAGLIAAIIAVLAVVGSIAGFLVLSPSKDGDPSPIGVNDPDPNDPDGTPDITPDTTEQTAQTVHGSPGAGTPGDPPAGSSTDGPDPGIIPDPDNTTVIEAAPVTVLVSSRPDGATVTRDGQTLGNTPLNVDVIPGEPVTITVSRRRFQDEEVTLDGSRDRHIVSLKRERTGSTSATGPSDPVQKTPVQKTPEQKTPVQKTPEQKTGNLGLGLE